MGIIETQYYYVLFLVFGIVLFLIVTDNSIATYFVLLQKLLKAKYEIFKWWILNNPRNPIVKYLIWRRSYKTAKEIEDMIKNHKE